VRTFGGEDSEIAGWDFTGLSGSKDPDCEIRGTAHFEASLSNRAGVPLVHVEGINLKIVEARQMSRDHASERAAAHNANFLRHRSPMTLCVAREGKLSARAR
jgi:hypothetical protein